MSAPTDESLFERWCAAPAPLLPLLHAFHARDGYLSDAALRAIAAALQLPLADLYGTVTFYHHLTRDPAAADTPRVCTGPICSLHGAGALCASLHAQPMPCAGRCDQPIPMLYQDRLWTVAAGSAPSLPGSPLPPPNPIGSEECVFAHLRHPSRATLDGYLRTGGYQGLIRALQMTPAQVIQHMRDAKLAGRGGAGFPTGLKWQAVADAPGKTKVVVCNADEGEPGCFKDRTLLDHDPHAVIEGMIIAAYATGASLGFLYLRYEYPETFFTLTQALDDARATHFLGSTILGSEFKFDIHLRRGAGAYICGEETSLLNSLEGKHPFPRNRPPYPVTHGFNNLPTAVNNVETLAAACQIMRRDPSWYHALGRGNQAGTKIISLSGDIARPGNYEVPLGLPLTELLYEWAGGPLPGHTIQAVTMAGLSGGFLAGSDLDITLDEPSLRAKNTFLGAGGILVFDERREMVNIAAQAMRFFAHESCGKCFPCRIGTQRLMERLDGGGPHAPDLWLAEVNDVGRTMQALSACGLGTAAPNITTSLLRYFPDQVAQYLAARHPEEPVWTT